MADPFIGEVMLCGFNFAPVGWAICAGQILPISSNTPLFALLGTFYGGNGTSNFALPNLGGRVPINQGKGPGLSDYPIGEVGGVEGVSLTTQTVPAHNHLVNVAGAPQRGQQPSTTPAGNLFGENTSQAFYAAPFNFTPQLNAASITPMPSQQLPHDNRMPFLTLNWCIALKGLFPPRS